MHSDPPGTTAAPPVSAAGVAALLRALPGSPMAGVTAHGGTVLEIVAATTHRARMVEEAQLLHPDSPAREVAATGVPIVITDLAGSARWPGCGAELRLWGVQAVQCQPLSDDDGAVVGVLSVYTPAANVLTEELADALHPVCRCATDLLQIRRRHPPRLRRE
ncbi:GAF domain-containing protein [Nocardia africana]|uniref:GAF domain-containing protein n=1 Tax=Nocardia africana TaxID=134964 RepID=A0A378WY00_9NOCA|nr:GAF domain-containing protein [Nocardia africana]MCC3312560.1 GAF domain-containing protein [Nocardia africana]SUA46118.1 Uncharacterised protein [Nocardia africana]